MPRSPRSIRPHAALAAGTLLALAGTAALPGCGGSGGGSAHRTDSTTIAKSSKPVWQQLKSDTPRPPAQTPSAPDPLDADVPLTGDDRDKLAVYAMDLQSLFDQIKSPPPGSVPPENPAPAPTRPLLSQETATNTAPVELGSIDPLPPTTPDPAPEPEPAPPVVAAAPPIQQTEAERKAELLSQLTTLLGQAGGGGGENDPLADGGPLARAVRLAALEAIEPGIADGELDRLQARMLPSEAAVLRPIRELFSRLGGSAAEQQDPAAIAGLLDEYAKRLAQARPLSIPTALFCERVESFGRYTPFRRTVFAAGRDHSAILYVEVEHFAQRTAAGDASPGGAASEQWITELGQTLDLHHDADGSLQWRQAEQVIRDASRRRRNDYYLVQRITLPATLSVGRYNLKITVNDKVSGATAQARIPIEIVADPSLAKTP